MAEAIVQEATPKKVAFMTKPKNVEERIKKDEKELEKLLQDQDRKSTRLNSSHGYISYAVFCLKKKKSTTNTGIPQD